MGLTDRNGMPLKDSAGREILAGSRVRGEGITTKQIQEGVVLETDDHGNQDADLTVAVTLKGKNAPTAEHPQGEEVEYLAHEWMQAHTVVVLD